jgi:hypothetical protein
LLPAARRQITGRQPCIALTCPGHRRTGAPDERGSGPGAACRFARIRWCSRRGQRGGDPRGASRQRCGIGEPLPGPCRAAGRLGSRRCRTLAGASRGGHHGGKIPAHRAKRGEGRRLRRIGMGCVLGTAIEPVTRRPRSWSPATRLAIVFNMAASAALIVAGWHHLAAAQTRSPERADLGTRARPLRASATHAESALGIPEVGHATPRHVIGPVRVGAQVAADLAARPGRPTCQPSRTRTAVLLRRRTPILTA